MDELTKRYYELSLMTEFDAETYPCLWYDLADRMDIDGRFETAATCRDRGNHYRQQYQQGTWMRVPVSVSHVEIVQR